MADRRASPLALLAPVDVAPCRRRLIAARRAGGALAIGCAIGAVLAARVQMTPMPELVAMLHSFVGAAAVLVGFANYLARRPALDGAERAHPPGRDLRRRPGRRGDVQRVGRRVRQAARQDRQQAAAAARAALAQPRRPARCVRWLLRLREFVPDAARRSTRACCRCWSMTGARAAARRPHGDGDRRRRHAGRRVDAEQLLGLGGGGGRLHAVERPADRHRRAGRLARARSSATSCARR